MSIPLRLSCPPKSTASREMALYSDLSVLGHTKSTSGVVANDPTERYICTCRDVGHHPRGGQYFDHENAGRSARFAARSSNE